MARLDRSGPAKDIAQWGAVLGREFTYEVIQMVTPHDQAVLMEGLDRLVELEVVFQRGVARQAQYRFKHALVQEVAYQSLPRRSRQAGHQRIAQVLETHFPQTAEAQPELLAYHYTEAGQAEAAVHYWQRAGQRALQRSAYVEAVAQLTQGLTVLASLPETPARWHQELDLQVALGSALMAVKGQGAPDIERAYARARDYGRPNMGQMDLLITLFSTPNSIVAECFERIGVSAAQLTEIAVAAEREVAAG